LFLLVGFGGLTVSVQAQTPAAETATVIRARHVCVACHGEGGRSENKATPSLAAQTREYLAAQLKDFRAQIRVEAGPRGYMWGISALLDDETIAGLADYYAAQKPGRGLAGDPALSQMGREIFVNGIAARGVRACASCHGDAAEGAKVFPRLAGQHADYVFAQLKEFGTALRPHASAMRAEVQALSHDEMRAVAEYVQSR
jgi:cytochrome c553